jgi:hypothetical protein
MRNSAMCGRGGTTGEQLHVTRTSNSSRSAQPSPIPSSNLSFSSSPYAYAYARERALLSAGARCFASLFLASGYRLRGRAEEALPRPRTIARHLYSCCADAAASTTASLSAKRRPRCFGPLPQPLPNCREPPSWLLVETNSNHTWPQNSPGEGLHPMSACPPRQSGGALCGQFLCVCCSWLSSVRRPVSSSHRLVAFSP